MARERMLVLASSQKLGGRCVAGLGLDSERLVRPVSATPDGTLHLADCRVDDGGWPALCEVVEFGHQGPDARPWQPENLVIDGTPWRRRPAIPADELDELIEPHLHGGGALLGNHGRAVPVEECELGMAESLALVEPEGLRFEHERVPWGKVSRARAWFRHGGSDWKLPITDVVVRPRLQQLPFGVHDWDDLDLDEPRRALLTISLSEPFDDWHYKLVAAVVQLPSL